MDNKLLARFIALHGVRNTELENLHSGITPSSEIGDFSDVKVITPYGEIPWNKLSRISDEEMRILMLDIEKHIFNSLENLFEIHGRFEDSPENFEIALKKLLNSVWEVSWDRNKI